ncbi:hypothetical protein AcW1_007736 [Taiwanofungus camphoratus]|nr:hypothetical protein AcW1_007736 [Antrodia cinnamomea]
MLSQLLSYSKHRQNLINLEHNKGLDALGAGAHIPPAASFEAALGKRNGLPLTDQNNNMEWTGTVSIGTPAQEFIIDFDTGSADLWVPAAGCDGCESQDRYDPSSSSTSQEESGTFSIGYGDGSTTSGPIYTDTVSVAGVTVTGQYLSAVDSESGVLSGSPSDGLMGMAFPALSQLQNNPFMWTAVDQGAVSKGEFGFKLSSEGAELYFGGVDKSLYTGKIEYHDISADTGFWQIGSASALINGQTAMSGFDTIIDSGTTLMYAPPDVATQFYENIDGAQEIDQGLYMFPCDSAPTVAFTWGGKTWQIDPSDFVIGQEDGQCVGALGGKDLGFGDNVWLVGDTFMRNVYSVFSIDKNAVGFAALA